MLYSRDYLAVFAGAYPSCHWKLGRTLTDKGVLYIIWCFINRHLCRCLNIKEVAFIFRSKSLVSICLTSRSIIVTFPFYILLFLKVTQNRHSLFRMNKQKYPWHSVTHTNDYFLLMFGTILVLSLRHTCYNKTCGRPFPVKITHKINQSSKCWHLTQYF